MAAPRGTQWPLDPHTEAKHAILRRYLAAWFPILGKHHDRVVYFDGFAGPGRYSQGEDGSPVIALKVARDHSHPTWKEIIFIFVEEDADRATWLQEKEIPSLNLPDSFRTHVLCGEFAPILASILDEQDARGYQLAPTFALIDPFGVTGLPYSLVDRLLARRRCEALITFMTSTVLRFVTELPTHVNELIGQPEASSLLAASADRVTTARLLYQQSLRRRARYVRFFEMRNTKNRPIYDLFFASNHPLGHERMKGAMWSVDAFGAFSFSDATDPGQSTLFTPEPGEDLATVLGMHFAGQTVDSAEVFAYVEQTAYLEKHARAALRHLESGAPLDRRIAVESVKRDGRPRKGPTFPPGVILRFPARAGSST